MRLANADGSSGIVDLSGIVGNGWVALYRRVDVKIRSMRMALNSTPTEESWSHIPLNHVRAVEEMVCVLIVILTS
jgi:hypothetical protein